MRLRIFRWWETLNLKSSKDWKSAASLVPTVGSLLLGLPVASCGGRTSQPEIQIPPVASEAEFHVAISGSDTDSGTKEHPFASLEKARDSARALHTNTTIWIHAGNHFLTQPFEIGAEDSGVVVRSVEDEAVTLCGAKKLSAANFKGVTDAAILARVATEAQGSLMELDLAALGVAHRKPGPDLFTDNGGRVELFVGGRRMPLSRYPNDGCMTMKRVLFNGGGQSEKGRWGDKNLRQSANGPGVFEYRDDRHARWVEAARRGEVWLKGYWRCVWQNEAVRVAEIDTAKRTVALAKAVPGGIGSKYFRPEGDGKEKYWLLNLLEEVDRPGEWCVDFPSGRLFFFPPAGWEKSEILLTDNDAPVVRIANATNVVLRGLTIEGSLDHGILVQGGASNLIAGCTVRNVARYGVKIDGGFRHAVQSCDVHDTGAGGVWLGGGGERASPRIAAGHRVVNCHIHHFGRIELVYAPGINSGFTGGGGGGHHVAVGMDIEHNLIHDGPHAGVLFGSWDSTFAYNDVSEYCQLSNDMGAFYCYDKFERSGNHRLFHNFIHDTTQGDGIYFDCDHRGSQVFGNVAYLCSTGKWGTAFLYKTGTQAQNPQPIFCSNNIAIRAACGFNFITPRPSHIANNVAVNCEKPYAWQEVKGGTFARADASLAAQTNMTYAADPGFMDGTALNFALHRDAPQFKDLPGFREIPFGKIGLYTDEYRRRLPTPAGAGKVRSPRGSEGADYEVLDRE